MKLFIRSATALLLAGFVSTLVHAATLTFTPAKDVMAKAKFPDTNFGADVNLQVSNQAGFQKIIYLQFTVSGIPAGSTGISAALKLRSSTTDTHTISAHSVASTSWGEA